MESKIPPVPPLPASCSDPVQYNAAVQALRATEYPMLKDRIYLDHSGTTLYASSLITSFNQDLATNLFGNPHSDSTPSLLSSRRVEHVRQQTLRFFNADPADFDLIFVPNATAAIKLVADAFREIAGPAASSPSLSFGRGRRGGFWYGYHRDSHSSLVGVREVAGEGNHQCFVNDEEVEAWIQGEEKDGEKEKRRSCRWRMKRKEGGGGRRPAGQVGLFAYPGQSNMTGRRLPLDWPSRIRNSPHTHTTYTLLDAAALASTSPLDLSSASTAPDFTALSFYKIFGFPNLGGLLVRKASGRVLLSRKYFGGGTVDMVIALGASWHARKDTSLHDQLEDGTLPFHAIFALGHALACHARLYGSMSLISQHTSFLAGTLYNKMIALQHGDGSPLVAIYNDHSATYGDATAQGATIAFNVLRRDGSLEGFADVEKAADRRGIYLRSGGLCNPGGIATYLNWRPRQMRAAYEAGHRCSRPTQTVAGKATGVVRVSMGAMSTMNDLDGFVSFLVEEYVQGADAFDGGLEKVVRVAERAMGMAGNG